VDRGEKIKTGFFLAAVAVLALAMGYLFLAYGPEQTLRFLVDQDSHTALFAVLLAVLPVLGFPLSVLLLMAGVKMGFWWGMALFAALVPLHMLLTHLLTHTFIRGPLEYILAKYSKGMPLIARKRAVFFVVIFTGFPGLPYAVKNCFLSLSNIPLPVYLLAAWPMHVVLAAPFVGVGGSAARADWRLGLLFAVLLVVVYFLGRWLKAKFSNDS
jgi:uncharacterized membrane protein YdjX (TVP38/TMEM64 family)